MPAGKSLDMTALALDSAGRNVSGIAVTWSTNNPGVASVTQAGRVTAVAAGEARISASGAGLSATSQVRVVTNSPAAATFSIEQQGITDVSLLGAWSDSTTGLSFAVGQNGVILRSATGAAPWTLVPTGTIEALTGVWGASASLAFAVGTGGIVLRWNGTNWSQMTSPTTATLLEVWGRSATEVYITGVDGTVYRWDGTSWIFVAPEAVLFGDAGHHAVVGIHFGTSTGPAWQSLSGSQVVGDAPNAKRCTPDPTAIPWLGLDALSTEGPGIFDQVTFLQRLNTVGGIAPPTPGSSLGEQRRVPYTAEYVFYQLPG
jgi:hypothetical protein